MSSTSTLTQSDERPAGTGQGAYGLRQWIGLAGGLVVATGMLLAPAPEGLGPEGWRTAAVGALMAIWWMTEALPIAATSLLPLVLFPLLGISGIEPTAAPYANPLIFLFMGGFMLALAMERWDLHRRLALNIIRRVGTRPHAIVAGFMIATAFISMWVSNTATTMMMLPIALSVVELVRGAGEGDAGDTSFAVVMMLVSAHASTIGGMATLVGTPTNALFAGFMLESYGVEIAFADWFGLGVILVVVALPLVYVLLTRVLFPIRLREIPGGRAFIEAELRALGPMKRPEKMVALVFTATALLWLFRPLVGRVVPGLSDAGIAITAGVLLFALPVDARRGIFVLDWERTKRLPWGALLLFGGGYALAGAMGETGLAEWTGTLLPGVEDWPLWLLVVGVVTVITFLSELTSNSATAAAFLPIVAAVAVGLGHNPLVLAIPTALAASCGFMLPVATPPNAIVYGSGLLPVPQMVRAGFFLNLLLIALITACCVLLMPVFFDLAPPATP